MHRCLASDDDDASESDVLLCASRPLRESSLQCTPLIATTMIVVCCIVLWCASLTLLARALFSDDTSAKRPSIARWARCGLTDSALTDDMRPSSSSLSAASEGELWAWWGGAPCPCWAVGDASTHWRMVVASEAVWSCAAGKRCQGGGVMRGGVGVGTLLLLGGGEGRSGGTDGRHR